ncbi:uncharacterized protein LOC118180853 [Stegodyphus dumicola]|uniref:uncharacterized protein LOC118180853 n=1 Tax=Stegodyphus dumicola TaxID=202533 RepID=UPI0015B23BCF|nr:uncharacterized protein LOC118180853 [Stegodyphus dumicola]
MFKGLALYRILNKIAIKLPELQAAQNPIDKLLGTVNTISHDHLLFRKASPRWVPKQLSAFDRHKRVEVCRELKERYKWEGWDFLNRIMTCDETWVHHFTTNPKERPCSGSIRTHHLPRNFEQFRILVSDRKCILG